MGRRAAFAYGHDIVMAAVSFFVSFYLRLGDYAFEDPYDDILLPGTLIFAAIAAGVFLMMGLYRGIWRYASLEDLTAITKAASLTVLLFLAVLFLATRLDVLPRSIVVINWFILIALLGGPRFLYRMAKDRRLGFVSGPDDALRAPVLLAGAGDEAEQFVRALARNPHAPYRVVGILAASEERVGREIRGVPVLGTVENLADAVAALKAKGGAPQRLVIASAALAGERVRALFDESARLGLSLARVPRLTDLKSGVEDRAEIRPIAVEDLLGRPQTPLDRDAMRAFIAGRRVLVTGAGGSIGGELTRQIVALAPAEVVLLDNSEYALYQIDLEIARLAPAVSRRAVLLDVRDRERARALFAQARPEIVFHAAALKHVPLVETNAAEGAAVNLSGTVNVADAARAAGAAAVVLISTDKAVNPASVMGATKRAAEMYCQTLDLEGRSGTRFVTVRFGNVLGSTGSVVPLFQDQLARGGPLTVTHPEMARYFMTVREAVELVIEAAAAGHAAHEGKLFVLDMGAPVRIVDLARQMIRLAGLRPDQDVPIAFTGIRPGEKLYEELFHGGEPLAPSGLAGIFVAAPRTQDRAALADGIAAVARAAAAGDDRAVRDALRSLVPEYRPAETSSALPAPVGANLDARADPRALRPGDRPRDAAR
ncbi:MAG: polysaccharide biosynthesis protein [Rhodospirillales bacterium]|nr:polysaccharide biosynthesis protein [Rhodospirillales bacterium]